MAKLISVWAACVFAITAAGKEVGNLGDPQALEFRGARSFSPSELRRALSNDFEYQSAARPSAPVDQLVLKLQERLTLGYRRAGFRDITVNVKPEDADGPVVLQIDEGVRYTAGRIQLVASPHIDIHELEAWLAGKRQVRSLRQYLRSRSKVSYRDAPRISQHGAGVEPVFRPGEPICFEPDPLIGIRERISDALAELGVFSAVFDADLKFDDGRGTVDLVVRVNEGSVATLNDIRVAGLDRNRPEKLITFLGLQSGMRVDRKMLENTEQKLRHCARFWDYQIELDITGSGDRQKVVLGIDLVEYLHSPRIGEAYPAHEEAARKLGVWLDLIDRTYDDLELIVEGDYSKLRDLHLKSAVSRRDGLAMDIRAGGGGGRIDHAFVLTTDQTAFYARQRRRKCEITVTEFVPPPVALTVLPGRLDGGDPLWLQFQLGLQMGQSSFLDTNIHPVALVHLTRQQDSKTSIRGDQLTIATSNVKLLADAASGRLDEMLLRNEVGSNLLIKLRIRPGAARELAQQLRTSADEYQGYAQGNGLAPLILFGLDELAYQISSTSNPDVSRQAAALASSMNEVLRAWWAKMEDPVAISPGASDAKISRFKIEQVAADLDDLSHLPLLGPALADAAFPRGGVPWTLVREICFVLEGKRDRGHFDELRRLISAGEMGPLGCLAVAELLEDNAVASAQVAQLGLNSLDEAHVRRDLESLLPRDSGMRAVINATGQLARAVPHDFREAVLGTLPSGAARILANWSLALERDRDMEPAATLMEVLISEWKDNLAEVVEARLQQLASRATAGSGR